MELLLPNSVRRKMRLHMIKAGRREIGGLIMAEELEDQKFRIVDFSVDIKSGSRSNFVRDSDQHEQALLEFYQKTGANYSKFNYLGEWHTHPSFSVKPSLQDILSMQDLVEDSEGIPFAVLFIARLQWRWRFEASAHLFLKSHDPCKVALVYE